MQDPTPIRRGPGNASVRPPSNPDHKVSQWPRLRGKKEVFSIQVHRENDFKERQSNPKGFDLIPHARSRSRQPEVACSVHLHSLEAQARPSSQKLRNLSFSSASCTREEQNGRSIRPTPPLPLTPPRCEGRWRALGATQEILEVNLRIPIP